MSRGVFGLPRWGVQGPSGGSSHDVVEVHLGLKRKAVFTLRHGNSVADGIVRHSLLGSKQRK